MTCREFKHSAASFTLWELTRCEDEQILEHTEKCDACNTWLRKQRTLAVSLQTLQASTAGQEAGPDVERALLRAFRQDTHQGRDPVFSDVAERSGSVRPVVTPLSTPMALKLSRFFEVGAYVATAAALLVGIFLGLRLLQHNSNATTAQSPIVPASVEAAPQRTAIARQTIAPGEHPQPVAVARKQLGPAHQDKSAAEVAQLTNDDSQSLAEAEYTALMLCDPLSCSSETQVVRVELPAGAGQSSQPQMADLVVGYDGVVRAVRMVH